MVLNGIDQIERYEGVFRKKRLGLITSISGVNQHMESTMELLHKKYKLEVLFAPEHGIQGKEAAGAAVFSSRDPETGIMIYSLYQKNSRHLTAEMVENLDAVVFDIQDVGVRFYTFLSTMIYTLRDCARLHKELIILDRINVLGDRVEGRIMTDDCISFVGSWKLCVRYGLTMGETAQMIKEKEHLDCELTVIPCSGWRRNMLFPETNLVWIMPSMALPSFETALVYAGTCLFEGTNLSEGRGTSAPFRLIGAPYITTEHLVKAMNKKKLPGVMFSKSYFTPTASKYEKELCEGVQIHVTDPKQYNAVWTALELLFEIKQRYLDQFTFLPPVVQGGRAMINLLYGNEELSQGTPLFKLLERQKMEEQSYRESIRAYYRYL